MAETIPVATPSLPAFSVRAAPDFVGMDDILFRVFVTPNQLFFIKIGGGKSQGVWFAAFGLIGGLIAAALAKKEAARAKERLAGLEGIHPRELIAKDNANHSINLNSVPTATIGPPKMLDDAKAHFSYVAHNGKLRKFTFENHGDVTIALEELSAVMGERLSVGVAWNEKKKKYVKTS